MLNIIVGAGHAREQISKQLKSRAWPAPTELSLGYVRNQLVTGSTQGLSFNLPKTKPGQKALRKGRVSLLNQVYLITTTTLNRQCFFDDFNAAYAAARCFENAVILGDAKMLAWVLMPDHAHWLISLGHHDSLSTVINRLKSSSSRLANRVLDRCGQLWSPGYHDHALRTEEDLIRHSAPPPRYKTDLNSII